MPLLKEKIFIHIPKCGGTSIEVQLGIDTNNLVANDEIFFGRTFDEESPYKHAKGRGYLLQHLTAHELKDKLIDKYILENTFTIVRNPLTRYISELNWLKKKKKKINNNFLKIIKKYSMDDIKFQHHKLCYEFIYDGNISLVNNIFKYENIDEAFEFINEDPCKCNVSKKQISIVDLSQEHIHSVYDVFFMDYNLFHYLEDNIIKYYLQRITEPDIIITFVNYTYLPIFNIFYKYFKKFKLVNFLVISLDDKTFIDLNNQNIFTLLFNYKITEKKKFWEFRYDILDKLFRLSKKNIIHTDSDCIWLKNITKLPALNDTSYDIIGSIGKGAPKHVVNKIGFVFCCGFFKINYRKNTLNFFKLVKKKKYNKKVKDDQFRINNFIVNEYSKIEDNSEGKSIEMKDHPIKILILKSDYINREMHKGVYCFHPCFWKLKTIFDKERRLLSNLDYMNSLDTMNWISKF